MDLLEYQGKQLLGSVGVPTPAGEAAETSDEAEAAATRIGCPVAVKAQVQVGGRGKAGGIKVAQTPAQARAAAEAIIGMDIKGHHVHRVWLEPAADIASEYYASFTLDRSAKKYLGMVSAEGGVEIETVAAESPEKIALVHIDPLLGLRNFHVRRLLFGGGIPKEQHKPMANVLTKLYQAFVELDAELVEVNPLVVTASGEIVALDAKVSLDDNAEYRHKETFTAFHEIFATDPQEKIAKEKGLNYVKLQGNVGIIGNGAGLVMSTLDVVAQAGGKAANFLDVGGGANAELMANALELVSGDPQVKSIFVNIFGGITRGELVAQGIVDALKSVDIRQPIVVRLDGTNAEEGRRILADNPNENLHSSPTMLDAANMAVQLGA